MRLEFYYVRIFVAILVVITRVRKKLFWITYLGRNHIYDRQFLSVWENGYHKLSKMPGWWWKSTSEYNIDWASKQERKEIIILDYNLCMYVCSLVEQMNVYTYRKEFDNYLWESIFESFHFISFGFDLSLWLLRVQYINEKQNSFS